MAYQPIYGSVKTSESHLQGQFAVTLTHPETGRSVSGETLQLRRDALIGDFEGYLAVGDAVLIELRLQDGRLPIHVAGRIVDRYIISTTHHHAMTVRFLECPPDDAARIHRTVETGIQDLIRFFKEFPLFSEFTTGDALLLSELAFRHFLHRRQVFFRRGSSEDRLDGLFMVRRGMVQIYRRISGVRDEKIAVASVGEIFGELSLVSNQAHSASIRAVNDSELIEINREAYEQLKQTNAAVAMKLMEVMLKVLARRLGRTTRMLFNPVRIR